MCAKSKMNAVVDGGSYKYHLLPCDQVQKQGEIVMSISTCFDMNVFVYTSINLSSPLSFSYYLKEAVLIVI